MPVTAWVPDTDTEICREPDATDEQAQLNMTEPEGGRSALLGETGPQETVPVPPIDRLDGVRSTMAFAPAFEATSLIWKVSPRSTAVGTEREAARSCTTMAGWLATAPATTRRPEFASVPCPPVLSWTDPP